MNTQDTPVNNFSQNIENLAYFEPVLKTLDDNFDFFFQEILKKIKFETQKLINSVQYQIRTYRPDFFLKKNKRTCSFI